MSELRISYGSINTTSPSQTADDNATAWDDDGCTLTYAALVTMVYRTYNELHALETQLVELRQRVDGEMK